MVHGRLGAAESGMPGRTRRSRRRLSRGRVSRWHSLRFLSRLLVVPEPLHKRLPAEGPAREQATDLGALCAAHPLFDEFWRERSAWEGLAHIKVPLYSSGV